MFVQLAIGKWGHSFEDSEDNWLTSDMKEAIYVVEQQSKNHPLVIIFLPHMMQF